MAQSGPTWQEIRKMRDDYVLGITRPNGRIVYPSYDELCEKYRVSPNTIAKYSKPERWLEQREQHRLAALARAQVQAQVQAQLQAQVQAQLQAQPQPQAQPQARVQAQSQAQSQTTEPDEFSNIDRITEQAVAGAREFIILARQGIREYTRVLQELRGDEDLNVATRVRLLRELATSASQYARVLNESFKTARLSFGESTENMDVSDWHSKLLDELLGLVKEGLITREEIQVELGELGSQLLGAGGT